ncbi:MULTISPECIES: chloride channel protein [Microbacterium]|uniref:chloride channel protein n=1 Tax=Microbacterium TaxID=33882 RepID=UPI002785AA6A|nr:MULTISPECIES: chloride channel protein [Microbacterium]MDQ1075917.1 H+/Cl- antiporter ClcA [Microbacterium sp. SORGH_AS_0969]MDQ1116161.1 H+/Cl- antiporter ClcA [Microbacterium testaceum]
MTAEPLARTRPHRRAVLALSKLGLATLIVGLATGLAVLLLVWIVHSIEHLVWGHEEGPFLDGLALPSPWWLPIVTVGGAGVVAALGWYLLRRFGRKLATVEQGVDGARMPWWETLADTVIQVTSVALGASIGKEVAPRELSAMAGSKIVGWFGLDARWRCILIASAAGAGLAAVYNVPLAGALFAIEILLAQFSVGGAVVALTVSAIATLVARPLVGDGSLYEVPALEVNASLVVAAVLIGPLMGWGATSFATVTKALGRFRPAGWKLLVVLPVTFAAVGVLGAFFPLILGNGRALATAGFDLSQPALLLLLLALLKYVATTISLGSGAIGGTLQPSVAIGAALGAAAAAGWALIWPGADGTALAIIAAAAFLASNMRAPFTAIALIIEFTDTGFTLLLPIFLAVAGSLAASRLSSRAGLRRFTPIDPARP